MVGDVTRNRLATLRFTIGEMKLARDLPRCLYGLRTAAREEGGVDLSRRREVNLSDNSIAGGCAVPQLVLNGSLVSCAAAAAAISSPKP